jgi:hypothetical protein
MEYGDLHRGSGILGKNINKCIDVVLRVQSWETGSSFSIMPGVLIGYAEMKGGAVPPLQN